MIIKPKPVAKYDPLAEYRLNHNLRKKMVEEIFDKIEEEDESEEIERNENKKPAIVRIENKISDRVKVDKVLPKALMGTGGQQASGLIALEWDGETKNNEQSKHELDTTIVNEFENRRSYKPSLWKNNMKQSEQKSIEQRNSSPFKKQNESKSLEERESSTIKKKREISPEIIKCKPDSQNKDKKNENFKKRGSTSTKFKVTPIGFKCKKSKNDTQFDFNIDIDL